MNKETYKALNKLMDKVNFLMTTKEIWNEKDAINFAKVETWIDEVAKEYN